MANGEKSIWITILSSGLAVAIFTFLANKAWEIYSYHPVGPKYVEASIRFEDGKLFLFVRNNSDEPLDLVRAKIDISEPELVKTDVLGAYPDVSKVYDVKPTAGTATVAMADNSLVLNVRITQAIAPKEADQFGVALVGLGGVIDLSKLKLHAELEDIKGNRYSLGL